LLLTLCEEESFDILKTIGQFLDCALKNNITTLIISINENELIDQKPNLASMICSRIFSVFINLMCLKVQLCHEDEGYFQGLERLHFYQKSPQFNSSILQELYVNVGTACDLLYLLDGRFNQLRTLHVHVGHFIDFSSIIIRQVDLLFK
jgi:hypothetical protein